MRKVLACILFLLAFCPFASGESMTGFNGPGSDALGYACTLSDGRMVFTGYRGEVGNYQKSKARLLCLNPDRTISWEYWDPAEGRCGYGAALVCEDGTLAVIFSNSPYQTLSERKIKFFTAEGVPLEKTVDIYRKDSLLNAVYPSFLQITVIPSDAEVFYRYFFDWDGNELFKISSDEMITIGHRNGEWIKGAEKGALFIKRSTSLFQLCRKITPAAQQGDHFAFVYGSKKSVSSVRKVSVPPKAPSSENPANEPSALK